jgi:hypothetical protein
MTKNTCLQEKATILFPHTPTRRTLLVLYLFIHLRLRFGSFSGLLYRTIYIPSSVPGNHNMLGPRRRRDRHNFNEKQYTHLIEQFCVTSGSILHSQPTLAVSFYNLYGEPPIATCCENARRDAHQKLLGCLSRRLLHELLSLPVVRLGVTLLVRVFTRCLVLLPRQVSSLYGHSIVILTK